MKSKDYLAGMEKAHEVALGCLPIHLCGEGSFEERRAKMLRLGGVMGIPIQAIEKEIEKVKNEGVE